MQDAATTSAFLLDVVEYRLFPMQYATQTKNHLCFSGVGLFAVEKTARS
jgi:hypothetical protein